MLLLSSADFFLKIYFFRNTISVSNGLDPDRDQRSVSPSLHLGSNCLQRSSSDDKSRRGQAKSFLIYHNLCECSKILDKSSKDLKPKIANPDQPQPGPALFNCYFDQQ